MNYIKYLTYLVVFICSVVFFITSPISNFFDNMFFSFYAAISLAADNWLPIWSR